MMKPKKRDVTTRANANPVGQRDFKKNAVRSFVPSLSAFRRTGPTHGALKAKGRIPSLKVALMPPSMWNKSVCMGKRVNLDSSIS